ncbi:hypothetical protein [Caniella muris]|uniref:hypothetical protein n=1 Tax=Caniella muris TaxID=2941502 RepID=UPI00203B4947|nr:hypothetical protein [Caniella muris]
MDRDIIRGYWPLYEDGAPVRIGDKVEGAIVPMEVEGVEVYVAATTVIGDCDHLHLEPGERVKRVGDAPADALCLCKNFDGGIEIRHLAGDLLDWHIVIDGERVGVSNKARSRIAEALDLCASKRRLLPGVVWPEVDGEPVVPGDVLWDDMGCRHEVSDVKFTAGFATAVEMESGDVWVSMDDLTRTNPKPEPEPGPDSWERLEEDTRKDVYDYWSCQDVDCEDCPAEVNGKDPMQRYGTVSCSRAKDLDILARAKALSGVTDDE